eukprot:m.385084 g.385084  ORF g.385084 m.385084 type:complete len:348 (+) comp20050_c8_seq11:813-1856(+)
MPHTETRKSSRLSPGQHARPKTCHPGKSHARPCDARSKSKSHQHLVLTVAVVLIAVRIAVFVVTVVAVSGVFGQRRPSWALLSDPCRKQKKKKKKKCLTRQSLPNPQRKRKRSTASPLMPATTKQRPRLRLRLRPRRQQRSKMKTRKRTVAHETTSPLKSNQRKTVTLRQTWMLMTLVILDCPTSPRNQRQRSLPKREMVVNPCSAARSARSSQSRRQPGRSWPPWKQKETLPLPFVPMPTKSFKKAPKISSSRRFPSRQGDRISLWMPSSRFLTAAATVSSAQTVTARVRCSSTLLSARFPFRRTLTASSANKRLRPMARRRPWRLCSTPIPSDCGCWKSRKSLQS